MQVVPDEFKNYAKADVRPHAWGARISFTKEFDDDVTFFTLNTSQLNGVDILGPSEDNPLQAWDYYEYEDYTDRIEFMSWNRSLDFPFSVVSARADFALSNTDDYFTPGSGSPVESYVLPKRPVRLLSGFKNILIPQFVGLTQGMPDISTKPKLATFTALDFLTQIYDMNIRETIAMQDVYTGEVLENILEQFGLAPTQYDIARGRNKIPFLFFERDQITAGEVIRKLMQAEMGLIWLSEAGIITFRPRLEQPSEPVYQFDESNIVDIKTNSDDQIINQVNITAELRAVQEYQPVYIKTQGGQVNVIPSGGSYVFKAELQDPCLTVEPPVSGEAEGVSWFVATRPDGTQVNTGVTVDSYELKTNSFDITFENANGFDVDISQLYLWGRPAKVYNRIEPTFDYEPSQLKYEIQKIDIDNGFIQSQDQAASLALTILNEYAEYASILELEVKGTPAQQLGDIVDVDYNQYIGEYRVIDISERLQDAKYTQIIKARHYLPTEWFTLDLSELNGSHVLAP
jgi:hypothetical protein